jgi:hypothetical protein
MSDCVALVLSPYCSPFGLLTVGSVYRLRDAALGFEAGWLASQVRYPDDFTAWGGPRPCGYAEVRDFLLGYVDIPYELACLIALWVTRDHATMFFLSFTVVL